MELTLRPTTMADLAEADALLARSYPKQLKEAYPPSVVVTALPLLARAQPGLVASGHYYAALAEGRIVGVGGWSMDRRAPGLGHVRHVVTDDRLVRRGIGRAVLTHALAAARGEGIVRMECHATRNGVPFYAALGFVEVGAMEVPLQPGITFPAVRMVLDLAQVRLQR